MLSMWTQTVPHPFLSAAPTLPHFGLSRSDFYLLWPTHNLCLLTAVGMKDCAAEEGEGGIRWRYYGSHVPLAATHSFPEGCKICKTMETFMNTFLSH